MECNNYTSMKNILGVVLTAVNIKFVVFWDMSLPSLVDGYEPFGAIYIIHLQDSMFLQNVGNHLLDYTVLSLHDMRYIYR
jgi:hypothetical protein